MALRPLPLSWPSLILLGSQALLRASAASGSTESGSTSAVSASSASSGSSGSSSGSSAGHNQWWKHEYEYNYCEAVILIFLVFVALFWEHCWHTVSHYSRHTYRYGELHDKVLDEENCHGTDGHGNVRHVRLMKELVSRMGGEFMTLGVLAFITFVFNNAGGFVLLEDIHENYIDFEMPKTKDDWLHMVEVVHVQLFMCMVLYFVVMGCIVLSGARHIRYWENSRLRRVREILPENRHVNNLIQQYNVDKEFAQYLMWRDYMIEQVVQWRKRRPRLYKATLDKLAIDENDAEAKHKLRSEVQRRFAFSAYLAMNVANGIQDAIHVHITSWLFLLTCFASFAMIHRFAEVELFALQWIFLCLVVLLILVMLWLVRKERIKIFVFMAALNKKRAEAGTTPSPGVGKAGSTTSIRSIDSCTEKLIDAQFGRGEIDEAKEMENMLRSPVSAISSKTRLTASYVKSIHQRVETELYFMRFLQCVLFLVCYVFAGTLIDFHDWKENFEMTLLACTLYTLLFILLIFGLQYLVPTFLALMALPPYVDEGNLVHFFALLLDDHMLSIDGSGELLKVRRILSNGTTNEEPSAIGRLSPRTVKLDELCAEVEVLKKHLSFASEDSTGNTSYPADSPEAPESDINAVWEHLRKLEDRMDMIQRFPSLPMVSI